MKRILLLLMTLLTTVLGLKAQNEPCERQVRVDLVPGGSANMVGYLPARGTGRAVVILPGGGYSHLAMQHEGHDWAPYFLRQGIACFILTYRMPHGDWQLPVADATNAILYLRDHAAELGIKRQDIGIMGSSAGGHLASTVSTHADEAARPDFQILFYPVITLRRDGTHEGTAQGFLGSQRDDEAMLELFSNEQQVKARQTPPAFIIAAGDDRAVPPVPNAVAYYSALQRAGIPAALHIYPSGGHGFGFRPSFKYHDKMLNELTDWLNKL